MNTILSKSIYGALAIFILGFCGCRKEDFTAPDTSIAPTSDISETQVREFIPGQAYVKLTEAGLRSSSDIGISLRASLGTALRSISDEIKLTPIFDVSGPYEARAKKAGLHLWMKVEFPEDVPVNDVVSALKNDPDVTIADGMERIQPIETAYTPVSAATLRANGISGPFNKGYDKFATGTPDPLLPYQWHYQNDGGEDPDFKAGADINLFRAWDIETGSPDVIVGIIDSGVWYGHPDLAQNMWTNPEDPGSHGYNFFEDSPYTWSGFHGTHVAGTIAAVNNNGIGVSGIAGGNGSPDTGVRIMSLQIFKQDGPAGSQIGGEGSSAGQIAKAFQYAADHGATILNCSWGYPLEKGIKRPIDPLLQAGMDYFIKNAGTTEDGSRQAEGAPMKGGVIFFAAGNDKAMDEWINPAYYEGVIAVGSSTSDYTMAYYSDSGEWVDIVAPGGLVDNKNEAGILSTISLTFKDLIIDDKGGRGSEMLYPNEEIYAYSQGTSMATPHVTGIAALILSKFGKTPGFTADMLKKRVLTSLKDIDHVSLNDPKYIGKIGAGYIDAAVALEDDKNIAPDKVTEIKVTPRYFDAEFVWGITGDADATTGHAAFYEFYLSEKAFDTADGMSPDSVIKAHDTADIKELTYKKEGLKEGTSYYAGIIARDRWGHRSGLTTKEFATPVNGAPTIVSGLPEGAIHILSVEPYKKLTLEVKDPEGHTWSYKAGKMPEGVSLKRNGDKIDVVIYNINGSGDFSFEITFTDSLGKTNAVTIPFRVLDNEGPKATADFPNVTFAKGDKAMELSLSESFSAQGGLTLTYSAVSSDSDVVTAEALDGKLVVTPKGIGIASVTIIASDGYKEARKTFDVTVTENNSSIIQAIYPLPAHSYFKILAGARVSELSVIITTLRGETVLKKTLPTDRETSSVTIETDRLAPGAYRLIVKEGGKTEERTIVKN